MKCPFCGAEFEDAKVKCSGCPMQGSCHATCCPNCGYELSQDSKLVDLARGLFAGITRTRKGKLLYRGGRRERRGESSQ